MSSAASGERGPRPRRASRVSPSRSSRREVDGAALVAEVGDVDDALVLEEVGGLRLAEQALSPRRVTRSHVVHELDRDVAPREHVTRAKDRAHAARADLAHDPIAAPEHAADQWIGTRLERGAVRRAEGGGVAKPRAASWAGPHRHRRSRWDSPSPRVVKPSRRPPSPAVLAPRRALTSAAVRVAVGAVGLRPGVLLRGRRRDGPHGRSRSALNASSRGTLSTTPRRDLSAA